MRSMPCGEVHALILIPVQSSPGNPSFLRKHEAKGSLAKHVFCSIHSSNHRVRSSSFQHLLSRPVVKSLQLTSLLMAAEFVTIPGILETVSLAVVVLVFCDCNPGAGTLMLGCSCGVLGYRIRKPFLLLEDCPKDPPYIVARPATVTVYDNKAVRYKQLERSARMAMRTRNGK